MAREGDLINDSTQTLSPVECSVMNMLLSFRSIRMGLVVETEPGSGTETKCGEL